MLVQIFEVILNLEYNVVVIRENKTQEFTLSGNELDSFLSNLSTDIVVEYLEVVAIQVINFLPKKPLRYIYVGYLDKKPLKFLDVDTKKTLICLYVCLCGWYVVDKMLTTHQRERIFLPTWRVAILLEVCLSDYVVKSI